MAELFKCILVGLAAQEPFAPTPGLTFAKELAKPSSACATVCAMAPAFYLPVTRTGGAAAAYIKEEVERSEEITR